MSIELWLIVVLYIMVFVGWFYAISWFIRMNERIDSINGWRTDGQDRLRDDYWSLKADLGLIAEYLQIDFVNKKERIVVKKGGPEQP